MREHTGMKRRIGKKRLGWLLFLLLVLAVVTAGAELSTNLRTVTTWNPNNKRLKAYVTYVDAEGDPVVAADKGYATVHYVYTSGNRVAREEFLDLDGNLVNCTEGYAYRADKYNSRGKIVERVYYDRDGQQVMGPEGYARQVSRYRGGYHEGTWQYDPAGNPVGTHRITEYSKKNKSQITSDSWYDLEDHLTPGPDGYARVENDYYGKYKNIYLLH